MSLIIHTDRQARTFSDLESFTVQSRSQMCANTRHVVQYEAVSDLLQFRCSWKWVFRDLFSAHREDEIERLRVIRSAYSRSKTCTIDLRIADAWVFRTIHPASSMVHRPQPAERTEEYRVDGVRIRNPVGCEYLPTTLYGWMHASSTVFGGTLGIESCPPAGACDELPTGV